MNIKSFLKLSDKKLIELENKYNFLPNQTQIDELNLSFDKACLKETARIARLHSLQKQTLFSEKKLSQKRKEAITNLFVRPK